MTDKELLKIANGARERAYAPYSGFTVGAALLCEDGEVFVGCNIESASFTPTCCAERVALFSAVAQGKRRFSAIAVSGGRQGEEGETCYPCGVCRQALSELCEGSLRVILKDGEGERVETLAELLPHSFKM